VTKADRYEPELNPTYRDLAEHFGVAVIPARVRKPKVELTRFGGVARSDRSRSPVPIHRDHPFRRRDHAFRRIVIKERRAS
jgi:hypothetical protein